MEGAFVFDDLPAVVDNADVDASKTSLYQLFQNNFWGQKMDAHDVQHQVTDQYLFWSIFFVMKET